MMNNLTTSWFIRQKYFSSIFNGQEKQRFSKTICFFLSYALIDVFALGWRPKRINLRGRWRTTRADKFRSMSILSLVSTSDKFGPALNLHASRQSTQFQIWSKYANRSQNFICRCFTISARRFWLLNRYSQRKVLPIKTKFIPTSSPFNMSPFPTLCKNKILSCRSWLSGWPLEKLIV